MSFAKLKTTIEICEMHTTKDSMGFAVQTLVTVAKVKAYQERKNATERWINRATFSEATDLFRFRRIPKVEITTAMLIIAGGKTYNIQSIEDIRSRKMYTEVLAKVVESSG